MTTNDRGYKAMYIMSSQLEIPRNAYQRHLNENKVRKIVKSFDEKVANEPKVSYRNGRYYVFDGQHTVAARVQMNGGLALPILCKVYVGLNEQEEALLFAQQTGESSPVGPGPKLRAMIYAGDPIACSFDYTTQAAGAKIDFDQKRGKSRISCVGTAFREFKKVGPESYREAIRLLIDGWDGDPDSLRAETVKAICRFVELYKGEYERGRLVRQFRKVDPLYIYRNGQLISNTLPSSKKYLYQVVQLYNGRSTQNVLPIKF